MDLLEKLSSFSPTLTSTNPPPLNHLGVKLRDYNLTNCNIISHKVRSQWGYFNLNKKERPVKSKHKILKK